MLSSLYEQIRASSAGLTLDDLASRNADISRRTLQRRLAALVQDGGVDAVGNTSSRRYIARPEVAADDQPAPGDWRSTAGTNIEAMVRRPLSERRPVGYDPSLVARYRSNVDAYLSPSAIRHLHDIGRSPGGPHPAGTYARQILDRLLIDLSWASSQLEGNTYTRLDTQNLIEFGRLAEGKDRREAQMILNHKGAIEMLVDGAGAVGFNRYTIQNLHAILAEGLLPDTAAEGRLRAIPVSISGTTYQPTGIPQVISECFDRLLATATAITDPFEQALFVMVHIPYLQPFEDVNKRVSRLAANIPLIRDNLAPLAFVDVPDRSYIDATLGVYELGRTELLRDLFVWAYERSCQRYTVLRDALPAPDPLRMRYRAALGDIIRETVRAREPIEPKLLRERARDLVEAADLETVVSMAFSELHKLHDGNIVRFGLRLSEFEGWRRASRS